MIAAIVTDIEGTTSSIDFVHTTLFPYAARHLAEFLRTHAEDPNVVTQLAEVDRLVGRGLSLDEQIAVLHEWIEADRKATPLKALQGMIWRVGYEAGELQGHVYRDVPPRLQQWHDAGRALYVYSSGSEEAQRLIFGYSIAGDLSRLFRGYFDTRIGAKSDVTSYTHIRTTVDAPADQILFLSDVVSELDAARAAGLLTCQLVRDDRCIRATDHPLASSFDEVELYLEGQERQH